MSALRESESLTELAADFADILWGLWYSRCTTSIRSTACDVKQVDGSLIFERSGSRCCGADDARFLLKNALFSHARLAHPSSVTGSRSSNGSHSFLEIQLYSRPGWGRSLITCSDVIGLQRIDLVDLSPIRGRIRRFVIPRLRSRWRYVQAQSTESCLKQSRPCQGTCKHRDASWLSSGDRSALVSQ